MADLQTQMNQAVADAAVEQIKDGMVLGLGSGSTAALMIQGLGAKLASGELKDIVGVTTSEKVKLDSSHEANAPNAARCAWHVLGL